MVNCKIVMVRMVRMVCLLPPLLIYLTNINSPKYSSKPIVGVIKKQYLCTQKRRKKLQTLRKKIATLKGNKKKRQKRAQIKYMYV